MEILARFTTNRFSFHLQKKKQTLSLYPLNKYTHTHTTINMSNLGALDMALDDVISQNRTNKRNNNSSNNSGGRRGGGINKNRSSGGRSSVC